MAFRGIDFICSTSAQLCWTFTGTADAMQSVIVQNPSAIVITVGGPDVLDGVRGITIPAETTLAVPGYSGDRLYVVAASATPTVRMLGNRV